MSVHRPAWVEFDYSAIGANFAQLRALAGAKTQIFAVLKGDAYGFGVEAAAAQLPLGTADGFAVSDLDEARRLLSLTAGRPILLYGSLSSKDLPKIEPGIIATVHSIACLDALKGSGRQLPIMVKLDCGFGRLGFVEEQTALLANRLAQMSGDIDLNGVYTHLGQVDNAEMVAIQSARFDTAVRQIEAEVGTPVMRMVASSRVLIGDTALSLDAINPGRALYGILEAPWSERLQLRRVLTKVAARIIAVKQLDEDRRIGYGAIAPGRGTVTVGIAPIGFAAGLPRNLSGAPVLVGGKLTRVLGLASLEHVLIDLDPIGGVDLGTEVVIIGKQGNAELRIEDLCAHTGLTELEVTIRLARNAPRRIMVAPTA